MDNKTDQVAPEANSPRARGYYKEFKPLTADVFDLSSRAQPRDPYPHRKLSWETANTWASFLKAAGPNGVNPTKIPTQETDSWAGHSVVLGGFRLLLHQHAAFAFAVFDNIFRRDDGCRGQAIAFFQVQQAHTLGRASSLANVLGVDADDLAELADHHHL